MFVSTSLFPQAVRQALREVKFAQSDIELTFSNGVRDAYIQKLSTTRHPRAEFIASVGLKDASIVISVAPEPYKCKLESKFLVVEETTLPQIDYVAKINTAIIHGSIANKGKPNTTAKMFIHPTNILIQGFSPVSEMSDKERTILYIFGVMPKGSAAREALARLSISEAEINSLVERGLLDKTSKGFAVSTMSKNLRQPHGVEHLW